MNESSDKPPPQSRIGSWLRKTTRDPSKNTILPVTQPSSAENGANDHCKTEGGSSELPSRIPTQDTPGSRDVKKSKIASIPTRVWRNFRTIIFASWINIFLLFVPAGIALGALHRHQGHESPISPSIIFALNAVAIIPLAYLLGFATENVARNLGDKVGALLNVTFGNAVELIIFIALVAKKVRIVQASLLGSILANLLLILGMSFLFGGLRFQEQLYNSAITQMSACLLSLSVMSLLLPTAFHASFSNLELADKVVVKVSRGTSVVLLLVYVLYLLFQLKSHAYIYESTPQHRIDEESHPGVLADILNSSSSSESSSSESDSDGSTGTTTTVKRIRKAIRKKRARKSSSGSKDSQPAKQMLGLEDSVPSNSTSPLVELPSSSSSNVPNSRIIREQESNNEEGHRASQSYPGVTTRDFVTRGIIEPLNQGRKVRRRRDHKGSRKHEKGNLAPKVDSSEEMEESQRSRFDSESSPRQERSTQAPRRPFSVRAISREMILERSKPTLQSRPSGAAHPQRPIGSNEGRGSLLRTTSMPVRLQQGSHPPVNIPSAQPLPHLMRIPPNQEASNPGVEAEEKQHLSRTASVILLLLSTGLVAACAEFLVDSIDYLVENTHLSQAFIGLIILPIVGNAAEHVTAVAMASKNKMDLAIGVALGSSIQIALFVTPIVVLLGWCLNTDMSLYFSLFETVSLFASAFIANYLMLDGRTNYLEGALLIAAYVIISVAAFFFPSCEDSNPANSPKDIKVC